MNSEAVKRISGEKKNGVISTFDGLKSKEWEVKLKGNFSLLLH